jgi:hypothetical protein
VAGEPKRLELETPSGPEETGWRPKPPTPTPVEVIFESPARRGRSTSSIVVVFNQPMVELGRAEAGEARELKELVSIKPPIEASYRWTNADTLEIEPEPSLRRAARYTATVRKGLESVSGGKLLEDHTWSFETERPVVEGVEVIPTDANRIDRILPSDRFLVFFNVGVNSIMLKKGLTLRVDGRRWGFRLKRKADEPERVECVPNRSLPSGAKVELLVEKGLRPAPGALATEREFRESYRVRGELRVSFRCGEKDLAETKACVPMHNSAHRGVWLSFSEPVTRYNLSEHLDATPSIDYLWDRLEPEENVWGCEIPEHEPDLKNHCSRVWRIKGNLEPETSYAIRLDESFRSAFGQKLRGSGRVRFVTGPFPAGLFLPKAGEGLRERWQDFRLSAVNAKTAEVRWESFTGRKLVELVRCVRKHRSSWPEHCFDAPATPQKVLAVAAGRNKLGRASFKLPPGLVAMEIRSPEVVDYWKKPIPHYRISLQTELGLHVRISPVGLLVWVTSLRDGRSIPGVAVSVYGPEGKKLWQKKTGRDGLVEVDVSRLGKERFVTGPPFFYVVASKGRDHAYLTVGKSNEGGPFGRLTGEPVRRCSRHDCVEEGEWGIWSSYVDVDAFGRFDQWRGDQEVHTGYVSTERGIYRPGQMVHVHGAVRTYRGWKGMGAVGKSLVVKLTGPKGRELQRAEVRAGKLGVFTAALRLPAHGKLGRHYVSVGMAPEKRKGVRRKGGGDYLAGHRFRVKEYRAPRFRTHLRLSPSPVRAEGPLEIEVFGRYYFGGAMGGARFRMSLRRHSTTLSRKLSIGGAVGRYVIGPTHPSLPDDGVTKKERKIKRGSASRLVLHYDGTTWKRIEGKLDANGSRKIGLDLSTHPKNPYPWPARHHVEAEITSSAQRSVAASDSVLHHPADLYVAVRTEKVDKKSVRYRLAVVTPRWEVRGPAKVTVRLHPISREKGLDLERTLWAKTVTVGKKGREMEIGWPDGYDEPRLLALFSVVDAKGRKASTAMMARRPTELDKRPKRRGGRGVSSAGSSRSSTGTDRSGSAEPAGPSPAPAPPAPAPELSVSTDKHSYLPGETARVTVRRKNLCGDVALFVEREEVFARKVLRFAPTKENSDERCSTSGQTATVDVEVEDRFAEKVGLHAVAVRGKEGLRAPEGPVITASSYLRVSSRPFRLVVGLETEKKTYAPRQRVRLRVRVEDGLGRRRKARVVVMAVDEAVLALTRYTLPDPLSDLFYNPSVQVFGEDLRRHLAPLMPVVVHRDHVALTTPTPVGAGRASGFGIGESRASRVYVRAGRARVVGGRREKKPRSRFLTTAWHETVMTDEQGSAETSFVLPDNLTEYRIMAFAVGTNRSAGLGATRFRVKLPLLALPSFPRFVRVGDRFHGGVTLHNASLPSGKALVKLEVEGARLAHDRSGDGGSGEAPRRRVLSTVLDRGMDRRVTFPLRAIEPGEATLRVTVEMDGHRDSFTHRLEVKDMVFSEVSAVAGVTRRSVAYRLGDLSGLRADRGGLDVRVASTALVGVEQGMEQLLGYPYGCLEQQASRTLPLLASQALGDRYDFELDVEGSETEPGRLIRKALQSIAVMQRPGGGFGYWPNSKKSLPWATAYALIVFRRAQIAGFVPEGLSSPTIRAGVRYLLPYLLRPRSLGWAWWSHQALILHALSLHREAVDEVWKKWQREGGRRRRAHPVGSKTTIPKKSGSRAAAGQILARFSDRSSAPRPLFAKAMLLAAAARLDTPASKLPSPVRKRLGEAVSDLTQEVCDSLRVEGSYAYADERLHSGYGDLLHSDARTTAMVLMALLRAKPDHPMVSRLARWFLIGKKRAAFRNTQEAAWALMAMWDYARIKEKRRPSFEAGVWLGKTRLVRALFKQRSSKPLEVSIPMAKLIQAQGPSARDMIIAKRGVGTLYYLARMRYARIRPPEKPRNHGFEVEKAIYKLDSVGRPLAAKRGRGGGRLSLGDTVVVTLAVKTRKLRRYVVVDDPLPAGLEPVDTSHATASRTFGHGRPPTKCSHYDYRELRDDRAVFFLNRMEPGTVVYRYLARVTQRGFFRAPPARAKEMYSPEVFGHTGSWAMRTR